MIECGDVIGFNSGEWDSRIIAALTRDRGERPTRWTHTEQAVGHNQVARQVVRKAIEPWEPAKRKGLIEVWRYNWLTATQRRLLTTYHTNTVGSWYGLWRLPVFGLQWLAGRVGVMLNAGPLLRADKRSMVCSTDVAKAMYRATHNAKFFGRNFTEVTPDDIADHIEQNPLDWTLVWRREKRPRGVYPVDPWPHPLPPDGDK